jgi:uracil-DNA glycosylase
MEREFGADKLFFFKSRPELGIEGYWGEGPVVFISDRPSKPPPGKKSATKRLSDAYFDALRRHRLEDSHLTDLVKHYPGTGLSRQRRIELNWPFLMEELEIVNAKIVVAVGSDAFSDLPQRLPSEPLLMPHYSNRYVAAETLRAKIDEVLSAVATARAALARP